MRGRLRGAPLEFPVTEAQLAHEALTQEQGYSGGGLQAPPQGGTLQLRLVVTVWESAPNDQAFNFFKRIAHLFFYVEYPNFKFYN